MLRAEINDQYHRIVLTAMHYSDYKIAKFNLEDFVIDRTDQKLAMFRFKRISTKLIIPVALAFLVLNGILLEQIWHYQKVNKDFQQQKEIASFEKRIDNNINRLGQTGVYIASIMASMDTIIALYEQYKQGADFEYITSCMESPVNKIVTAVEQNLGITPRIHFHVAPTRSFYRCWTDKRGDDLSSFRYAVTEVLNTGKVISGVEIGRGGFVVRGIVPIIKQNEVLGSVEAYFSMQEVMKYARLSDKEEVAIFMNTDLLDIATKFANTTNIELSNPTIGKFILLDRTNDDIDFTSIPADSLSMAMKKRVSFEKNDQLFVLTPLRNYNQIAQGVGVFQIDVSDVNSTFSHLSKSVASISLIVLIFLIGLVAFIIRQIVSQRLKKVDTALERLANGLSTSAIVMKSKDELGNMVHSLNKLISRTKETAEFAEKIGSNKFDTEFSSLSDNDLLGNALLEMREELKKAKEEELKREQENQHRNWTAQGVAMFSDLLRKHSSNIEDLAYEVISNMVRYLKANQGGIFIVNDDDPKQLYLELKGCYAFDRKKILQKQLEPGEGLVGRCFQEKEKIYLTEIPENYIKITSGLGDRNPTCLLLMPLSYNNQIYGIIELASFSELQAYEMDFIERVSESIAATISLTKSNIQTAELLEKSQQQAEEMLSQEEEMRQNMEELQATQEESSRREAELNRELEKYKKQLDELLART